MVGWALVAFAFGVAYSWVATHYYRAIAARQAFRAAAWDGLIGLCAIAPLQAWAASGQRGVVLVAEVLGSMAGTYLAARQP